MGIKKSNHPEIKIHRLEKDLEKAILLINKFLTINNIELKYSITLDYKLEAFGEFDPSHKYNISLNPAAFYDTQKERPHAKYYTEDFSLMSVAIHEFNHLLDERLKLGKKYEEEFPKPFFTNDNCKVDRREELSENLSLYFLNPYFLKLINKERFNFFKNLFVSPTPVTKANFIKRYKSWNPQIHQLCLERWGIKILGNRIFIG